MELADNTEESADDMTAAETAPNPMNETAGGVRYCKTNGKRRLASLESKVPLGVSFV